MAVSGFISILEKAVNLGCPFYPKMWDDVEHTFFIFSYFKGGRAKLRWLLGKIPVSENMTLIFYGDRRVDILTNETLRENVRNCRMLNNGQRSVPYHD